MLLRDITDSVQSNSTYFESRLCHVGEKMSILDELAPSLLVLNASGVAKLLRTSTEVNDVGKFEDLRIVLKFKTKLLSSAVITFWLFNN